MHEAMLYEKLPNSRVRCHTCQWRCTINPGKFGVCGMYQNRDGTLYNLNYAIVSSVAADPIEKKPLFHFFPGSLALSLGTLGCNFHCLLYIHVDHLASPPHLSYPDLSLLLSLTSSKISCLQNYLDYLLDSSPLSSRP